MLDANNVSGHCDDFLSILNALKDREQPDEAKRNVIPSVIYTLQQSIGATLDALPAGQSNRARKINGDLFERLIKLLICSLEIDCTSGIIKVPVKDEKGNELFKSSYQHDLLINNRSELKVIGSVKTSSKDRIDKIFLDKFLYNKLTDTEVPHIAIFLNDVQRAQKKNRRSGIPAYGISPTFLPGHFKAFTIKLNSLDGVYYCDLLPSMRLDKILREQIQTIDHFFYSDLWELLSRKGQSLAEVEIEEGEFSEGVGDDPNTDEIVPVI